MRRPLGTRVSLFVALGLVLAGCSGGGSGSASVHRRQLVTVDPRFIAIGDLNGDGLPDVVAANLEGDEASLLINRTAPSAVTVTLAPSLSLPLGMSCTAVATLDLDGDGIPDVVAIGTPNPNTLVSSVFVFAGTTPTPTTTPTFAAPLTLDGPQFPEEFSPLVVADFNGDGRPDLAAQAFTATAIFINTSAAGSISFASRVEIPTGHAFQSGLSASGDRDVSVGDLDGDGRPDLIVTVPRYADGSDGPAIRVFLSTTPTGSAIPTFAAGVDVSTDLASGVVAAVDLNGDGRLDLAYPIEVATGPGSSETRLRVLLNETPVGSKALAFAAMPLLGTNFNDHAVAAADLDGDGKPDLVMVAEDVLLFLNRTPVGASATAFDIQNLGPGPGTTTYSIKVGDLLGNGVPQIAVAQDNDRIAIISSR